MPKKVISVFIVLLLGIGLFYLLNRTDSQNLPLSSLEHRHGHDHNHGPHRDNQEKGKQKGPPSTENKIPRDHLARELNDLKKTAQQRVYTVRDLELNPHTSIGKKNIDDLVVFINSSNPLAKDPEAHKPHSFKSHQLKKEASLRVYSLKRLDQELSYQEALAPLNDVINHSNDKALRRIAEQVLAAKKKGQNYFENLKKGILGLDPIAD